MEIVQRLFFRKSQNTYIQLFRYLFVAAAAFAVNLTGLILLKEVAHLNYLVAASLSFCLGVIVNFALSVKWIFNNSKLANRHQEFVATAVIATVGLIFNDLILWALTSGLGVYYLYSKLFATALIFFWNFFLRRQLLYKYD